MTAPIIPHNTLMGLPDELLVRILKYAVATDEVVQLGPDTFLQDLDNIRDEVLAPFEGIPHLLSIAKEEFDEGRHLQYRMVFGHLRFTQNAPRVPGCGAGSELPEKDFYFDTGDVIEWFGTGASHIRHLELFIRIYQVEGICIPSMNPGVLGSNAKWPFLFDRIGKAFPDLRSLKVTVVNYEKLADFFDFWNVNNTQTWRAYQRPDLIASQCSYRLGKLIEALRKHETRLLGEKSLVLCQERSRVSQYDCKQSHCTRWKRESLETYGVDAVIWQMMDLECSRLDL